MASLHKPSHGRTPYWWGKFKLADGRFAYRSTGEKDKRRAWEIVRAWQYAEDLAAKGEATEQRLKEVLSETLRRLGHEPISTPTVRVWLDVAGACPLQYSDRQGRGKQRLTTL